MHRKSRLASTVGTILAAIAATVVGVSAASLNAACGGSCSHQSPGVDVNFGAGIASNEIASVTVTGACGPVPSPLCDPTQPRCAPVDGWDVYIPSGMAGICAVHVALKDGEVFDDTVSVSHATVCGVDGYYGDHVVPIRSTMGDAGSGGSDAG